MIWEFPRSVNPGKLPLITVLVGVRNFIRFGLVRNSRKAQRICDVSSYLCLNWCDISPSYKKKNRAIKRKIFHLITTLRFFKIRIKKKWPLSPEKCCSEGWNTHPRLIAGWVTLSTVLTTFLCLAQWKWHQGQILKEKDRRTWSSLVK